MFKVGVIGLGNHFLEHILSAIKLSHDIDVDVICDIDQVKIDNAKLYLPNAKVTTKWQDVFKMDLDVIFCISFPQLHEEVIELSIKHNIPVFVEKPPYLSSKAIDRLTKLKRQHKYKKPIGVGINFNFSTMSEVIQNIIATGKHGQAIEVDICHLSNKPDQDVWGINNPLQTMLLAQAIHPLSLMTMFTDKLGSESMSWVVTDKGGQSILKMVLPGSKNGKAVSGTIRTGNLGPRFLFRMSVTLEDGTRLECTPEHILVYDINQFHYAGTNKWVTAWEAKTFMSGIEKGGYAQEIDAFLQAIREESDHGMYSPKYFHETYQVMEKVLSHEQARK